MTKAVVYARVSTEDQAENGFSLAAQLEATHKYAEARGWEVVGEFVDDGVSGAIPFADRPAGVRAWAMLKSGAADALICQNVDRLSRDVVDLLVTIRELLRLGVEVHCLDLGRVTSEYDIMLVIRGWQGSDERAKIRERSMRGKRQKLAQGMVMGSRRPYGYDFLRDARGRVVNFVVNENEARVVRLIYQLYTKGDGGAPLSLYAVAQHLTAAGIPTQQARKRSYQAWTPATLTRILNNTVYKGEWRYHFSDTGEIFVIKVPAIVDAETWEAAQVQRGRNSRKAARNAKRDYLLRGIIRCGCGYSMVGMTLNERYYSCSTRTNFTKEARPCHSALVRADKLEALVWDYFKAMLTDPTTLEANLRTAQAVELEAQEPKQAELATVTALIAEAEAEAAQLADALTKARGIVYKLLEDRMTHLNARYEALVTRRGELEAALQQRLTEEAIQAALALALDVKLGVENADYATKRQILDLFDARVTVKDGRVLLIYSIQSTPIVLQLSRQTQRNRDNGRAVITVELAL